MPESQARKRRADAQRSAASIVGAAVQVLNDDPDASMEAIARAAGVTRQTVYAHFPSRERLLQALLDHVTSEAVTAIDAADIDSGPAMDALFRLLEASDRSAGRYPVLLQTLGAMRLDQSADAQLHAPVADRLRRILRRGQEAGEFDRQLSTDWLIAATINLGHAAGEAVGDGRLSKPEADHALRTSLLRILTPGPTR
ncbi:TetR/AcrR family transcriptional regulator [Actinomadura sp. 7K507]|uniref:TetR/AcrR family transcriptional regulator n=1 Tax=Actinomadura sp. 7K507 TaxID=2530365 RepID=UPI0010459B6A|nr:TetR/AcrR family transcriptional regulator [Actinomadura sp. 7K507]TDC77347.1 TetR/AcrR family transcriptional regulator [Actinomadura sp. 7K507]